MIDYSSLTGCKVQIQRTDDEIIEGVVNSFNRTRKMLSILKAYSLKKGKYLADEMNILLDNIEKIEIVTKSEEVNEDESILNQVAERVSNAWEKNGSLKPLECQEYDTEWQSIPFSLKSTLQPSDANLNQSNQPLQLNVKSTINLKDLPCWHYISDYDTAETILKKEFAKAKRVSFRAFADHTRTLHANVSLICIGFEETTYMFDFMNMQNEHKHNDFLDILSFYLSDKSIRTIVYDNMFISELFFHKYNLVINEIFDLHVAFANQFKSIEPLRIEDLIFELKPDLHLIDTSNDELNWTQRPLSREIKYKALAETCFLLEMYESFIDCVIADLSQASKHFNYPLLGKSDQDLNLNKNNLNPNKQANASNASNQLKTNTISLSSLSSSNLSFNNKPSENGFDTSQIRKNPTTCEKPQLPKHSHSNTIKITSTTTAASIVKATCELGNELVDDSLHKTDKYVSNSTNDYYSGKYVFVPAGYSGHKTSRKKPNMSKFNRTTNYF